MQSLETFGVRAACALAGTLPARAVGPAGRALGRVAWASGVRRRVTRDNLERAFGAALDPRARAVLARRAYEHLGLSFLEFLRLGRERPEDLAPRLDLRGDEHLQAALSAGHGAIVVSGHLGNWEVMSACLAARGYPVTFVVQRLRNPDVDRLVQGIRRGAGIEVIDRGMAVRRVHDALRANRLVFFMCDQDARRRGLFVPLFGVPASTPKGAAQFAIRAGTPFIPVFGWRVGAAEYRVEFTSPVPPPAADEEESVRAMLGTFNARLESAVRRAPEQYWWAHRRWKTTPSPALRDAG